MKTIKSIALSKTVILCFAVFLFSCNGNDEENLFISEVPEIFFKEIKYHKRIDPGIMDTIALTISFRDGDMNLGLTGSEVDSPYHALNYYYLEGTSVKKTSSISHPNLVKIGDSDTLPPYNCRDYAIKKVGDKFNYQLDTLYVEPNIGYSNIYIEFYFEKDGQYILSDYFNEFTQNSGGFCNEHFNGRFPIFDNTKTGIVKDNPESAYRIILNSRFEGELRCTMESPGFSHIFKDKKIKLRVRILDRDLNQSNWIETPPMVIY